MPLARGVPACRCLPTALAPMHVPARRVVMRQGAIVKARWVFGVSSCWCRILQTDAGGSTGARIVGRAGIAIAFCRAGAGGSGVGIFVMRTCVPLWVGLGVALCGTGVFTKAGRTR